MHPHGSWCVPNVPEVWVMGMGKNLAGLPDFLLVPVQEREQLASSCRFFLVLAEEVRHALRTYPTATTTQQTTPSFRTWGVCSSSASFTPAGDPPCKPRPSPAPHSGGTGTTGWTSLSPSTPSTRWPPSSGPEEEGPLGGAEGRHGGAAQTVPVGRGQPGATPAVGIAGAARFRVRRPLDGSRHLAVSSDSF